MLTMSKMMQLEIDFVRHTYIMENKIVYLNFVPVSLTF